MRERYSFIGDGRIARERDQQADFTKQIRDAQ